jgi:hypothetical protein
MTKEEAIQTAESFLEGLEEWIGSKDLPITPKQYDAIEFLINKVKESE